MKNLTPVLLITGYLGSGKTTLLNRILANSQGIRFAVIVNDIGEVNIDASLIQQGGIVSLADDSLVALQNGCICCTLRMDLVQQLHDIIATHLFDYIAIEASGICEPGPIAQTICSMPDLDPRYTGDCLPQLDCIATVVDALRLRDEFRGGLSLLEQNIGEEDIENLVIQQIEFCNLILLNKAADVTPQELRRITEVIRALQPKAEIIPCNHCDVPLTRLLHTHLFDFEATATSATWVHILEDHEDHDSEEVPEGYCTDNNRGLATEGSLPSDNKAQSSVPEVLHHHDHHHHHHDHDDDHSHTEEYGIGTYVFRSRKPMNLTRFDHFVARQWPTGIIRTKGMCYFKGEEDTCYLFEQAGKQVSLRNVGQWYATMPEAELKPFLQRNPSVLQDWDPEYGDRMQKLVFIGQHLDTAAISSALNLCLEN